MAEAAGIMLVQLAEFLASATLETAGHIVALLHLAAATMHDMLAMAAAGQILKLAACLAKFVYHTLHLMCKIGKVMGYPASPEHRPGGCPLP